MRSRYCGQPQTPGLAVSSLGKSSLQPPSEKLKRMDCTDHGSSLILSGKSLILIGKSLILIGKYLILTGKSDF